MASSLQLQPTSDGLKPASDGLQPTGLDMASRQIAMASNLMAICMSAWRSRPEDLTFRHLHYGQQRVVARQR